MADTKLYLIWSNEHDQWWKSNSMGYTEDVLNAGHFEEWEAFQIVRDANKTIDHDEEGFSECMIPFYKSDTLTEGNTTCSVCNCDCKGCDCDDVDCKECGC